MDSTNKKTMKFKFYTKKIVALFLILTSLSGCLSIARMSDFSKSSNGIDFDKYSTEYTEKKEPFRTTKTSNEYYYERNISITEREITDIIQYALKEKGYRIYLVDFENNDVIAKRGMRANEWNSITGVYYKIDNNKPKLQIYINTKITQDFTGGWGENRARKVGNTIETLIDSKK